LQPNTKSAKIKTRFTGHGMEFSANNQIQCCEFYNNTHTLTAEIDGASQRIGR
jgi:hypothetical protein